MFAINSAVSSLREWFSWNREEKPLFQKIHSLFENRSVAAIASIENRAFSRKQLIDTSTGATGGIAAGLLAETTGPMVALHEVVGHGLLGYEMTDHVSAQAPTYEINGWENLKAIGKAGSFQDGVTAFFQWISGHNASADGNAGVTHIPPVDPNGIGQAMGSDGHAAWISIAGSIPGLAVDTLSVVGGMHLRKRHPKLGTMLVSMGLTDSLFTSAYPISAAAMSSTQLQEAAKTGHDFANFALHMGNILDVSAQTVAICTAAFWVPIVPLAAILAYLHTKSSLQETVPDTVALQHLIRKANTDPQIAKELGEALKDFPQKESLNDLCDQIIAANSRPLSTEQLERIQKSIPIITEYLLDHLSSKTVAQAKQEVLTQWSQDVKPDPIQTALTASAVIGNMAMVTTEMIKVFSTTVAPSLGTAATTLSYCSPLFSLFAIASSGYQAFKDYQAPDTLIPKSAKRLSVARLLLTITCAVLTTIALLVPGLNAIFFGVLILSLILNVALSYARTRIIQKQFALIQALQPNTWNVMYQLWLDHQTKPAGTKMSSSLQKWTNLVHPASIKLLK